MHSDRGARGKRTIRGDVDLGPYFAGARVAIRGKKVCNNASVCYAVAHGEPADIAVTDALVCASPIRNASLFNDLALAS